MALKWSAIVILSAEKPMNTQLVDSLVQIIESLTQEERALLQERLNSRSIQIKTGVCGGQPRIRNTRIPVWTLVAFRQQGADDQELLRNYPSLSTEDLTAAWAYYEQHREECDRAIASFNEDNGVKYNERHQYLRGEVLKIAKISPVLYEVCYTKNP